MWSEVATGWARGIGVRSCIAFKRHRTRVVRPNAVSVCLRCLPSCAGGMIDALTDLSDCLFRNFSTALTVRLVATKWRQLVHGTQSPGRTACLTALAWPQRPPLCMLHVWHGRPRPAWTHPALTGPLAPLLTERVLAHRIDAARGQIHCVGASGREPLCWTVAGGRKMGSNTRSPLRIHHACVRRGMMEARWASLAGSAHKAHLFSAQAQLPCHCRWICGSPACAPTTQSGATCKTASGSSLS